MTTAEVLRKIAAARGMAPQPEPAPEEVPSVEQLEQPPAEAPAEVADEQPTETGANPIVDMLVKAYCAEVCAAYQYEWARLSCQGKARNYLESECDAHRKEEWEHAEMLYDRINTLHGTIPFTLAEIHELNPTPGDPEQKNNQDTAILAQQILNAEQSAVDLYTEIEAATKDVDPVTNDMIIGILATEQDHVTDFEKILITIGAE